MTRNRMPENPRVLVRLLLAALISLTALTGSVAAAATASTASTDAAAKVPGPVVLIGMAGVRWEDLSADTPALSALLANGAVADLAARSVGATSCPVDGWLALSAGRRADAARTSSGECVDPDQSRWADYVARAKDGPFRAVPGTLADNAAAGGATTAAIGPGASVALTRSDGTAPPSYPAGPEPTARSAQTIIEGIGRVTTAGADLILIDLGGVGQNADEDPTDLGVITARNRRIIALDEVLKTTLEALPPNATVAVASIADAAPQPALQFTAVVGKGADGQFLAPSLLRSGSTRQDGLILTTDLTPTLLTWLGAPVPDAIDGSLLTPTRLGADTADRVEYLLDLEQRSTEMQRIALPVSAVLGLASILALGLLLTTTRRAHEQRPSPERDRRLRALEATGLLAGSVPVATVASAAVPWWRTDAAGLWFGVVIVAIAAAVALIAAWGPWRRHRLGPVCVVAVATVTVLVGDVAAGSPWSVSTLLGGDPLTAGRFYGFGNPIFAVFGVAALVIALTVANRLLALGRPNTAAAAVMAIGLLAAIIDVLPALGSDVGGAPALLPAFAWLALRTSGRRVTWQRVLVVAVGTAALVIGVALVDWLRPPAARSHLGRFVQTVVDGGGGEVIVRKLAQNLGLFALSPITLLAPLVIGLLAWVLVRPQRFGLALVEHAYQVVPLLKDTVIAAGVMALIGFLANDTGLSIPPAELAIGVPLLLAVAARTVLTSESGVRPGRRPR